MQQHTLIDASTLSNSSFDWPSDIVSQTWRRMSNFEFIEKATGCSVQLIDTIEALAFNSSKKASEDFLLMGELIPPSTATATNKSVMRVFLEIAHYSIDFGKCITDENRGLWVYGNIPGCYYKLETPSKNYEPLFVDDQERINFLLMVREFIVDHKISPTSSWPFSCNEDVLDVVHMASRDISDDFLIKHARFLYNNLDRTLKRSCRFMKSLLKLSEKSVVIPQVFDSSPASKSSDQSSHTLSRGNNIMTYEPVASSSSSNVECFDLGDVVTDSKEDEVKSEASGDSDDIIEIINDTSEGNLLPHLRPDCSLYPFRTSSHSETCKMCWCYICDAPVGTCVDWSGNHCHANPYDKAMVYHWKQMKAAFKKRITSVPYPSGDTSAASTSLQTISAKKSNSKAKVSTPSILNFFQMRMQPALSIQKQPVDENQSIPLSIPTPSALPQQLSTPAPIIVELLSSPSPPPTTKPSLILPLRESFGSKRSAQNLLEVVNTEVEGSASHSAVLKGNTEQYGDNHSDKKPYRGPNNSRVIEQVDMLTGEVLRRYASSSEAATVLNISSASAILNCIQGRSSSSYGFYWRYCEDFNVECKEIPEEDLLKRIACFKKQNKLKPINISSGSSSFSASPVATKVTMF